MNLYPYLPFYNYKVFWVNYYLNELKIMTDGKLIKDVYYEEISWDVIEYYLTLAYDFIYFGNPCGPGLRMVTSDLVYMVDSKNAD